MIDDFLVLFDYSLQFEGEEIFLFLLAELNWHFDWRWEFFGGFKNCDLGLSILNILVEVYDLCSEIIQFIFDFFG